MNWKHTLYNQCSRSVLLIQLFSKLLIFKNVLRVNLSVFDTSDCNTY